jgi:hypothetical protein
MIPRTLKQAKAVGKQTRSVDYDRLSAAEQKKWIQIQGKRHEELGLISKSPQGGQREVCTWDKDTGTYICHLVSDA